jgi:hypothetical protein
VSEIGPYLATVLAAMRSDDARRRDAQERCRRAILDTTASVLSGERNDEVRHVVECVLGLDPEAARRHVACITGSDTGLVAGGFVDRAAVATVLTLRARHRPSVELASVTTSLESLIDEEVLVEG